jgi:hypothetical protein
MWVNQLIGASFLFGLARVCFRTAHRNAHPITARREWFAPFVIPSRKRPLEDQAVTGCSRLVALLDNR